MVTRAQDRYNPAPTRRMAIGVEKSPRRKKHARAVSVIVGPSIHVVVLTDDYRGGRCGVQSRLWADAGMAA